MAAPFGCIVIICGQSFGQKRQPPCFLAPQGIHWASIKSERKRASSPAGFRVSLFRDLFPRHTESGSPARVQFYSLLQHIHMGAKSEQLITPVMQLRWRVVGKWLKVWDVKRLWLWALGADDSDKLPRFLFYSDLPGIVMELLKQLFCCCSSLQQSSTSCHSCFNRCLLFFLQWNCKKSCCQSRSTTGTANSFLCRFNCSPLPLQEATIADG